MDDGNYAVNSVRKLHAYQKAGFMLGRNLIVTTETAGNPINSRQIEEIAESFLLNDTANC